MKQILIGLSIIALFLLLFMGGFKLLAGHIYGRTDCERFNIDNIEVRTGIDIPAVSNVDCSFDASINTKFSTFTFDKNEVDLEEYVVRNDFEKNGDVYLNTGERTDTKWQAELNPETYVLTVKLEYK